MMILPKLNKPTLEEELELKNFMQSKINNIILASSDLRNEILNHKVYKEINSSSDLRIFMSFHAYPVWDFMCLLKALQRNLTSVDMLWYPKGAAETRYLINEIVLAEESDIDSEGNRKSHYEMYLDAMTEVGASTSQIQKFVEIYRRTHSLKEASEWSYAPKAAVDFVSHTMDVVMSNKPHVQAAVFTFGREHLIPDMFTHLINDFNQDFPNTITKFKYYLDRHIELDGGHHSNLAIDMTIALCGKDLKKWKEAEKAVLLCLKKRIELWDAAYDRIKNNKFKIG